MRIGIDAGHGGSDPGAVSPARPSLGDKIYTEESDLTLEIAKRVQGILLACGHEVSMTRTTDANLSLSARTNILNKAKCDIAVSIHLNSVASSLPSYIATFIQAAGGQAEHLAKEIHSRIATTSGWPNGGVRVKNLHMTRETKMPAVLVELGFVSNPAEERQLNDPLFRGKLAAAVAGGILAYKTKPNSWQLCLLDYAINPTAGQKEIKRAGAVYAALKAAGKITDMEATHRWANQVRQAMGLPET